MTIGTAHAETQAFSMRGSLIRLSERLELSNRARLALGLLRALALIIRPKPSPQSSPQAQR